MTLSHPHEPPPLPHRTLRCGGIVLCGLVALAFPAPEKLAAAPAGYDVDLKLVIGVDISRSMDRDERLIQRDGYVQAFRSQDIIDAVRNGPSGRIAVTYFEWAGETIQWVVLPWTIIDGPGASRDFADQLAQSPLEPAANSLETSISAAVLFGALLFDASPATAPRRVIDISGDGPNSRGPLMLLARDAVVASGVTINGLPIAPPGHDTSGIPDLGEYYRQCVVGGPGAFVVPVERVDELPAAIRRKLALEVADRAGPPAEASAVFVAAVNCSHGL